MDKLIELLKDKGWEYKIINSELHFIFEHEEVIVNFSDESKINEVINELTQ